MDAIKEWLKDEENDYLIDLIVDKFKNIEFKIPTKFDPESTECNFARYIEEELGHRYLVSVEYQEDIDEYSVECYSKIDRRSGLPTCNFELQNLIFGFSLSGKNQKMYDIIVAIDPGYDHSSLEEILQVRGNSV